MPIIHPHACGIDVGSRTHYVAVGPALSDMLSESSLLRICKPALSDL